MTLKLYYNPGSCSLAAHAALYEADLDHALEKIDLAAGAQEAPEYLERNIWGRVPLLDTGRYILTENCAILPWIAAATPERGLLPRPDTEAWFRAIEWMAILSGTVHVAFRPIFRPNRLASSEAGQADVSATGLRSLNAVLAKLEERRGEERYTLGGSFSLVDLYLFVFLHWTRRPVLTGKLEARPGLDAAYAELVRRPAILRALAAEGLSPNP